MDIVARISMDFNRYDYILETIPDSKYEYIVQEIIEETLRKEYLDQYKDDGKTSQDPMIGKLQGDIAFYTHLSAENRKQMSLIISNIERSNKDPKDKDYKRATPNEQQRWEQDCGKLQMLFVTYKDQLEQLQPILDRFLFLRFVEDGRRRTMKMLRDKFIEDSDKEFLAKGVTWATEYAHMMRTMV